MLGSRATFDTKSDEVNGLAEQVEFLPASNQKKLEKDGPKRMLLIVGAVITVILLVVLIPVLVWHFHFRPDTRIQMLYSGSINITNRSFAEDLENPDSEEFIALEHIVQKMLQDIFLNMPNVGQFYVNCTVTAFSEGTPLYAYYWAEFKVPPEHRDALDIALSHKASLARRWKHLQKENVPQIVEFTAATADRRLVKPPRDHHCSFSLHAAPGKNGTFTSPGFPNSPYPPNSRCQWAIRADPDYILELTFITFNLENECSNDFVSVYDSLSPIKNREITELCGTYSPTTERRLISSRNVLLVILITDDEANFPGFKAEFRQIRPKKCGGVLEESGKFFSPYYPALYPARSDCTWTLKVPTSMRVKLEFKAFLLQDATKEGMCLDYVEVNGRRKCGEKRTFVELSNSKEMTVRFHSDDSDTDSGFEAEFTPYDAGNPCPDQFACTSGRCIDETLRCDGWNDCGDNFDEMHCKCKEDQFKCANGLCKSIFWQCDGMNDCEDNSDEKMCDCDADEMKCNNGRCYSKAMKCDGNDDCEDGTDEAECDEVLKVICTDYTYKCKNGKCISKKNPECDGEKDCADGSDEVNCDCGIRPFKHSRIVGGVDAQVGEWPWQVSLHIKQFGHVCGASVISNNWLVSAAHCFQDESKIKYSNPGIWKVFLGLHTQFKVGTMVKERKVKRIITHESYNQYTFNNDIALLELDSSVPFSSVIRPICLPDQTHRFPVGKATWVSGWGARAENDVASSVLQKAELRILNSTTCNRLLSSTVTSKMICAGYLSGGIDACQGDSGGPMSFVGSKGKVFLAGIVSWGDGCARRNKPGVYTRTTKFRKWIKDKSSV
ncbi:suppressor of tumorigenicity 14 protein homolog [Callorhinchus milii]|uniref:Suppressor of tumorigenicity 14 protein homolog n=1 Tax=Callorhinchus milii TaxID=7868 RepID=A0A4W3HI55_CALMI|nr:suppressor of tumorigenicity 14 protein homolog [Callorhinchus milii]|eukprot:gi/632956927/ref/XP_007894202.1/ PREDICTED: suppressor of tumorigenicity 14 protein [Callorhinchus milii]